MSILDNENDLIDQNDEFIFKNILSKYPIYKAGYDAFGRKLAVGDYVIYATPKMGTYTAEFHPKSLVIGKVTKLCSKKIAIQTISELIRPKNRYNPDEIDIGKVHMYGDEIIKITDFNKFLESL